MPESDNRSPFKSGNIVQRFKHERHLLILPCIPTEFLDMPRTQRPEKLLSSMRLSFELLSRGNGTCFLCQLSSKRIPATAGGLAHFRRDPQSPRLKNQAGLFIPKAKHDFHGVEKNFWCKYCRLPKKPPLSPTPFFNKKRTHHRGKTYCHGLRFRLLMKHERVAAVK